MVGPGASIPKPSKQVRAHLALFQWREEYPRAQGQRAKVVSIERQLALGPVEAALLRVSCFDTPGAPRGALVWCILLQSGGSSLICSFSCDDISKIYSEFRAAWSEEHTEGDCVAQ